MAFRIAQGGNEHIAGDQNCPGCESYDGSVWPQTHRDSLSKCTGLVHIEHFPRAIPLAGSEVHYYCDGCKALDPL